MLTRKKLELSCFAHIFLFLFPSWILIFPFVFFLKFFYCRWKAEVTPKPQQIKNEHKAYQSKEFLFLLDVPRVWSEPICFQGCSCRRCLVRKNVEETGWSGTELVVWIYQKWSLLEATVIRNCILACEAIFNYIYSTDFRTTDGSTTWMQFCYFLESKAGITRPHR